MKFFHSGAVGDLVYGLITIKSMGGGELWLPERAQETNCFHYKIPETNPFHLFVKRFLERQPYVERVVVAGPVKPDGWDGVDMSQFRGKIGSVVGGLAKAQWQEAGKPASEFPGFDPWVEVDPWNPFNEPFVVVHRSARYHCVDSDWQSQMLRVDALKVFVGTIEEYNEFPASTSCKFVPCDDLYGAARLIGASLGFYGNTSSYLAVAQALGKKRWVENSGNGAIIGGDEVVLWGSKDR